MFYTPKNQVKYAREKHCIMYQYSEIGVSIIYISLL